MSVLSLVVSWPAMTMKLTSPEAPRCDALHRCSVFLSGARIATFAVSVNG